VEYGSQETGGFRKTKSSIAKLPFAIDHRHYAPGSQAPFPVCSERIPASCFHHASSDKIRSRPLRDQTAGKIGLDLYVRVVSKPTVL
jgi:hypothetical protein